MEKQKVRALVIEKEASRIKDAVGFFKTVPQVEVVFAPSLTQGIFKWNSGVDGLVIDEEKFQQVDSIFLYSPLVTAFNMIIPGAELIKAKLSAVDIKDGRKQWKEAWELAGPKLLEKKG